MGLWAVCECGTRVAIYKRAKAAKEMENHARNAYGDQVPCGSCGPCHEKSGLCARNPRHDDYTIEVE